MTERRQRALSSLRSGLRQLVIDVGGPEAFSKAMWPKRCTVQGAKLINHWLDPHKRRREKPSLEDVERMLLIGRIRDCHVAINTLTDSINYSRVKSIDPQEKLRDIAERIQQHQAVTEDLLDQYRRLQIDFDATQLRNVNS